VEDRHNESGNDDEDDGMSFLSSSRDQQQDEQELNEAPEELIYTSMVTEAKQELKTEFSPIEESEFQETFASETQASDAQFDAWICGVKETMLSFPKLLRARVKKQINDLVSDFEINYLESLDAEKRL
jgi:hypothetical protein